MSVAIIIPTLLSEPDLLSRCLESIFAQKTSVDFSVYLMSNTTTKKLDTFRARLPEQFTQADLSMLHFLALGKNTGFTGAVNAGIEQSSEELVVLLNDDTEVTPKWLHELVQKHQETSADMIASTIYLSDKTTLDSQGFTFRWRGQAIPLPQGTNDTALDNWKNAPRLLPTQTTFQEPFGPDAAAALYTRQLLDTLNNLNPHFFAYLEDVDLALRARLQGYSCALAEDAIVHHHKHATSSGFSGFKARQDFLNWWRIVSGSYPWLAWIHFGPLILWERVKNFSGMIKAWK